MSLQTRLEALAQAFGADTKALRGVVTTASTATLTPTSVAYQYQITAQAAALVVAAPTGTPINGQSMRFRFKDNGTARAISWNAIYRAIGVTLPTTTVVNKTMYVSCVYNSADTRWDVLAVGQEA